MELLKALLLLLDRIDALRVAIAACAIRKFEMIEALRAASAATKVEFTIVILELRAEMQKIQLANRLID